MKDTGGSWGASDTLNSLRPNWAGNSDLPGQAHQADITLRANQAINAGGPHRAHVAGQTIGACRTRDTHYSSGTHDTGIALRALASSKAHGPGRTGCTFGPSGTRWPDGTWCAYGPIWPRGPDGTGVTNWAFGPS
jgi:hypothetical protein